MPCVDVSRVDTSRVDVSRVNVSRVDMMHGYTLNVDVLCGECLCLAIP
jgi:hypothetical protein